MKILMTGAGGFLGSRIARNLAKRRDITLILLKRVGSSHARIEDISSGLPVYEINADLSALARDHEIDVVIHAAVNYGRPPTMPSELVSDNVVLPLRILEAFGAGLKCFINTDTFFNDSRHAYSHMAGYTLSKKQVLDWLEAFARELHVVNMRLEHIYGPADGPDKFIPTLMERMLRGEESEMDFTPGEKKRDFIFVEDAARAYECVLDDIEGKTATGEKPSGLIRYQVGTGEALPLRAFIEAAREATGYAGKLNFGALPYRAGEIDESCADIADLKALGWAPRTSMREGVALTAQYHRKQFNKEK